MNINTAEYPRPLLKRASFYSLDGTWQMNGQPIIVPLPIEAQIPYDQLKTHEFFYKRSFELPADFCHKDERVLLHFNAVDQLAEVRLNGQLIASHQGGYLPFSVDITDRLQNENLLEVKVTDELDFFYPYGKQAKKPHGMWYTPVSGIWQSVWLEAVAPGYIEDLTVLSDDHSIDLHIESQADSFTVSFGNFHHTYHKKDIHIEIDDPQLWSPAHPYLYDLCIETANDKISSYFALRKIEVREIKGHKRLFLNDEPLLLKGLLDQGYFPYGIYVPEHIEDYEKDILNIKELGYNFLRKHIKVEPEAFYYYCDKHGILVMQDMVNSGKFHFFSDVALPTIGITSLKRPLKDQERFDFFIEHGKATIKHLRSHPCIFSYTIYNEGWGQQAASKAYDILKETDPDRLFDATSGWFADDHSDFDSYHVYFRNKVLHGKDRLLLLAECGGFIRDISDHVDKSKGKWGYGKTASEAELTDRIKDMYASMIIPSIKEGLVGFVMTQISDVEGEINGLYTYDRQVCKVNKKDLRQANEELQKIYESECISQ